MYFAFELMNGSRKPRLPSEIENLQFLYPDIVDTDAEVETETEVDSNGSQMTDLVKFTKTKQEHILEEAGKNLIKSKEIMKKQYDSKVSPITYTLNISDNVLIENMSSKRSKGGKLQDKWIGPYPITKVANSSVQFYRNSKILRVKRSKVRPWRDPHGANDFPPNTHTKLETPDDIEFTEEEINALVNTPNLSPESTPVNH